MKFLIVEDSRFTQIIMTKLLKKYFHDIDIAVGNDGLEGLKKYKEINPDYVFVDLLMPKLKGIELIKKIKEYDNNARIFVVTADVQKSIKEEVEALTIKGFINKPFNEEKAKYVFDIIKGDSNER